MKFSLSPLSTVLPRPKSSVFLTCSYTHLQLHSYHSTPATATATAAATATASATATIVSNAASIEIRFFFVPSQRRYEDIFYPHEKKFLFPRDFAKDFKSRFPFFHLFCLHAPLSLRIFRIPLGTWLLTKKI